MPSITRTPPGHQNLDPTFNPPRVDSFEQHDKKTSLCETPPSKIFTKFGKLGVISFESDWIVNNVARVTALHRKVLAEHRFNFYKPDASDGHNRPKMSFGKDNFIIDKQTRTQNESLAKFTERDRLTIYGHGTRDILEDLEPHDLAQCLKLAGLKKIGVIKLSACNVGTGNYLERFADELKKQDIAFAYLSAPKGFINATRYNTSIFGIEINLKIIPAFARQHVAPRIIGLPLPEKFMLKTVKGNLDIEFKNTRYAFKDPSAPDHSRTNNHNKNPNFNTQRVEI